MNLSLGQDGAEVPGDLGPYRFDRRLGVGGMGEVFLAFDGRLGRHVALKRLRLDLEAGGGSQGRERFRREARAAARLSHAGIVQVFDLIETDSGDWIVMEYVEGPRLADLAAHSPLPLRSVLLYGRQIAEGLSAAHALGLVHRDLKTENVLIAETDPPTAKILDFGLVQELRAGDGAEPLTRAGVLVGTLRSVAPEQILGLAVGPRADLFALGVLLYEIATARSPFRGATAAETLHRIVAEPPAPLPSDLPAGLGALIGQLLQKAPELRPASAAEVAKRLGRLAAELGESVEEGDWIDSETATESIAVPQALARDSSSFSTLRKFPTRLAVGAAAIAALLGGAAYFGFLPNAPAKRPSAVRSDAAQPFPASARPLSPAERKAFEVKAWAALDRYDLPGNLDRAVDLFQRLIEDDLDSAEAHAGLARAYWRKLGEEGGDTMWREQALAVARRAVELDGKLAPARVSLGLILLKAGKHDEAREELEQARSIDPRNADAYRGLAEVHQAAEETTEAESDFKAAIALRPRDRTFHDLLGTLYFRSGRMKEAEAECRRSVELAPDGVIGLRNLAAILIATDRLPEAGALLLRAIAVQPKATLYGNLGTVYFYQGLYPAAADAYQKALEFPDGSSRHDMWGNLGDAWRQIPHRRNEAPEAFRNAARLIEPEVARDPANAKLRSQWALYLAKAGQKVAALREAAQVDTPEARPLFRLAIACEVAGDRERALGLLQRAIQQGFSLSEVAREPDLLNLRGDTRFQRLLSKATG